MFSLSFKGLLYYNPLLSKGLTSQVIANNSSGVGCVLTVVGTR